MKAAEYPHEMWCPSIDVCAICAGHDGPHQCSAEAVQP